MLKLQSYYENGTLKSASFKLPFQLIFDQFLTNFSSKIFLHTANCFTAGWYKFELNIFQGCRSKYSFDSNFANSGFRIEEQFRL